MLYNDEKNIDYINMNLKRNATEDEIQVLNSLWKEMLPYRYLKSFYKRRFSKNTFSEKIHKKVKVKNHTIIVKPSSRIYKDDGIVMNGDCLKNIVALGMKPNALSILSTQDNQSELNDIADYYNLAGVPVTNALFDTKEGESALQNFEIPKRADIFCLSLKKSNKIKKQKVKSGYNIVIIGSETVTEGKINTDSFMQKKLIDASLEIVQRDISCASKTCNEGLFSAIVKMIKNKNYGIYINIDNLHKITPQAPAWQSLTASTPERLIFAVKDWKLVDFIKVVDKYEIPFSIIGKIDKSNFVKVVHKGNMVINLPKKIIFNPITKVNNTDYEPVNYPVKREENLLNDNIDKILNNENFVSFYNKFKTFDSIIGNKTCLYMTENGVSELWYEDIKHYISTALHTMHLQFDFDPYLAGENLVNEAVRKIAAMGHTPIAISIICCLNFSKQGEVSRFEQARKGIFYAVKKLKIKLLNLDVTNDDKLSSVSVLAIGKAKRSNKILVPYFNNNQNVYLIGKTENINSTSLYQSILDNNICTKIDTVDYKFEKKLKKLIKKLQKDSYISSCISVDRFGILGALYKALRANKLGMEMTVPLNNFLLNEVQSRYLISSNQDLFKILKKSKIPFIILGKTNNSNEITYK